ncbi:hypothetical protein [Bartonella sp. LJL80]
MLNKLRSGFFSVLLCLCFGFGPIPLYAQGLPELPPQEDPESPLLSPEDMIPEKPSPDEALPELGKDQNAAERKQMELDRLFASLKRTVDVKAAATISRQIQGLWAQSGSDTIDLLMQWAEDGINEQNYALALDFLDNVVALQPDYAEGWMRRAAVHIQTNDIKLAMLELNETLKLEPRNYNAMVLLGSVMEMTDRDDLALKAYEQALQYYPQMRKAQSRISDLLEEQTDKAI